MRGRKLRPAQSAGAALLTVGDEDAEQIEEVAVYCPEVCGAGVRLAVAGLIPARNVVALGMLLVPGDLDVPHNSDG